MVDTLAPGADAPNFDLASTEDVVLMLRDEVPRMTAVLYFFAEPESDRTLQDLRRLAAAQTELAEKRAIVLGISRTKLDPLKQLQRDLNLQFPLLFDDRNFSAAYGIEALEEGSPDPALFVVDRNQKILWMANPIASIEGSLPEVLAVLGGQPAPTYHYPAKVVNRVVDWWVNKVRPRPA